MKSIPAIKRFEKNPPFWLSLLLCAGITGLMSWLRLGVYHDRVFPLASGLPLLLCLWNRDVRLLYGMSAVFTAVSIYKIYYLLTPVVADYGYINVTLVSQLVNTWLVAFVVHGLIRSKRKLEKKNHELDAMNCELEATNEELAATNEALSAREEEITHQNEELQCQAEELEQQTEELRQQAEETEQQSAELQELNLELLRKDRGLQTLLDSGRWLSGDMNEAFVMNGICQATVQVFGEGVQAAAVAVNHEGDLVLKGDHGFGLHGAKRLEIPFEKSLGCLVIESGRTASIESLSARPDIRLPSPAVGPPYQSVLASPIWIDGVAIGTLEAYSVSPRHWSDHEFRIAEWLAGQAAVALQAICAHVELEQKRRDAEEASIQKTRFLAAVSHDVRTPANAISLLAEFIRKCASDPAKYQQIPDLAESLWSNARSMVDLVSDVLDITRLDSGYPEVEVSDFSLCDLIRAEVRQSQPHAESKGLKLVVDVPMEDIRMKSDRIKLARVLSNLVSNALKFTEAGEVRVECLTAHDGGLQLHVRDTGIGIPSEQLVNVFDEFYQLRNPERNREKGAGLGLAICRRLAGVLGFKIRVKSVLGVGTTFIIDIPPRCLRKDDDEDPLEGLAGGGGEDVLRGLSILLVEDHPVAREMTAELLAAEGATVVKAGTGRDAIRILAEGGNDVLLLDLNLPDFDGVEILKRLQNDTPEGLRWVLVVSADVRPERVEEVMGLGAHAMISKPVSLDSIRSVMSGALSRKCGSAFDEDALCNGTEI